MMKGCVGKQGTNVWNPGRCGGRSVHHHQFYFKCYLEVEEFEFRVSAGSQEHHCLPQKQHTDWLADCFHGCVWEEGSHGFIALPRTWGTGTAAMHKDNCSQGSLPTFQVLYLHHAKEWLILSKSSILCLEGSAAQDCKGHNSVTCKDTGRESLVFPKEK